MNQILEKEPVGKQAQSDKDKKVTDVSTLKSLAKDVNTEGISKQNDSSAEEKSRKRAAELNNSFEEKREAINLIEEDIAEKIVEKLNQTLAVVHTSSTYILMEKDNNELVLDSKASLLSLYENQIVWDLSEGKGKAPTKAQIWLKSLNRRTYKNIVFNPKVVGHYDGNYNIWKGFAVSPIKGDCSLFWGHILEIICSSNKIHYNYVRKWLAHLIQKPWIIATALVMRGKQGTGKGTFVEAIGKLLGSYYAPLASLDQILGRFNSHLKNAILVFADEAIWGGNKREVGAMKSLITEPKLFIEAKGKDGYWIDNFKHLIVSSNEDWAVHLDPDDRRFFVLDISSKRKEDIDYFKKISSQMENGGYEALMYDLLNENLSEFDPRIMPENFSGFDMKMESTSSVDRFIYTSLKEGCWDHINAGPSGELKDMRVDTLYNYYTMWCQEEDQKVFRKEQFGKRLKKIIPETRTERTPSVGGGYRPRIYKFPSIKQCRNGFEKFYKQNEKIWD